MKILQIIFVAISLFLIVVWLLSWTPVVEVMPQVLKQFMFVFGGLLTFVVPVLVILVIWLVLHWMNGRYRDKSENIKDVGG